MAEYTNTALSTDYDKLPLKVIIHSSLLLINKQSKHARNVLSKQEAQAWLAKGRMKRKEEETGSSLLTKSYTYIIYIFITSTVYQTAKNKNKTTCHRPHSQRARPPRSNRMEFPCTKTPYRATGPGCRAWRLTSIA